MKNLKMKKNKVASGALVSASLLFLVSGAGLAFEKSPADYASYYDRQLPKPRQTMEEISAANRVRQGAFARQLIYSLEYESRLPLAASEDDAITLLRSMGISPLKGWDRFAPLTEDDATVIIGKTSGKEYLVHDKAQEVCDEIVKLLNVEWELYKVQNGRYALLEKLILDKSIFPRKPECPYGNPYAIGGLKPHVMLHEHLIRTPAKNYLFQEKDFFKQAFGSKD